LVTFRAHNDATLTALEETMDLVEEEIKAAKIKFEDDILKIAAKAENPHQVLKFYLRLNILESW
jgi:hypothetical protein